MWIWLDPFESTWSRTSFEEQENREFVRKICSSSTVMFCEPKTQPFYYLYTFVFITIKWTYEMEILWRHHLSPWFSDPQKGFFLYDSVAVSALVRWKLHWVNLTSHFCKLEIQPPSCQQSVQSRTVDKTELNVLITRADCEHGVNLEIFQLKTMFTKIVLYFDKPILTMHTQLKYRVLFTDKLWRFVAWKIRELSKMVYLWTDCWHRICHKLLPMNDYWNNLFADTEVLDKEHIYFNKYLVICQYSFILNWIVLE